jgi:hypothetical protein
VNILDENILAAQRQRLLAWGIPVRHIGYDLAQKGKLDEQIIPLLHELRRLTFFTRDLGFYSRRLCHPRYCLVCMAINEDDVAIFARRFLRHPEFNTEAKRLGFVVRIAPKTITAWYLHGEKEINLT